MPTDDFVFGIASRREKIVVGTEDVAFEIKLNARLGPLKSVKNGLALASDLFRRTLTFGKLSDLSINVLLGRTDRPPQIKACQRESRIANEADQPARIARHTSARNHSKHASQYRASNCHYFSRFQIPHGLPSSPSG